MINFNGTDWVLYHGSLIADTPPHVETHLTDTEAKELLRRSGAFFLRWHSNFDSIQKTEFWHIIKEGDGSIEGLGKNTRNQVRKGLKNCIVNPVSAHQLSTEGYKPYANAMRQYKSDLNLMSPDEFRQKMESRSSQKEYEFWSISDCDRNIIGYAQNKIQNNACNYLVIKIDPRKRHLYPGYALIQKMNEHYLSTRGMKYVNDGARSIRHESEVQDFLVNKFKFRKAYSNLHLVYSPITGIIVRALFPFRSIFKKAPGSYSQKIRSLLAQEAMFRNTLSP